MKTIPDFLKKSDYVWVTPENWGPREIKITVQEDGSYTAFCGSDCKHPDCSCIEVSK